MNTQEIERIANAKIEDLSALDIIAITALDAFNKQIETLCVEENLNSKHFLLTTKRLNIPVFYFNRLLNSKSLPNASTLLKMAECFDVSCDVLLGRCEETQDITYLNALKLIKELMDDGHIHASLISVTGNEEDCFYTGYLTESPLLESCWKYCGLRKLMSSDSELISSFIASETTAVETKSASYYSDKAIKKRFSNILTSLYSQRKLMQKDLMALLDTDQSTVSRYLNGEQMPSLRLIYKLADEFDVSIDFLLGKQRNPLKDLFMMIDHDLIGIAPNEHLDIITAYPGYEYVREKRLPKGVYIYNDFLIKFVREYSYITSAFNTLTQYEIHTENEKKTALSKWFSAHYQHFDLPLLNAEQHDLLYNAMDPGLNTYDCLDLIERIRMDPESVKHELRYKTQQPENSYNEQASITFDDSYERLPFE